MSGEVETVKEINPATDMTTLQRTFNRGLFVSWINKDLVRRARHDVRKSYIFYDKEKVFMNFALINKLNDEVLPQLRAKGVYYWSKGL